MIDKEAVVGREESHFWHLEIVMVNPLNSPLSPLKACASRNESHKI